MLFLYFPRVCVCVHTVRSKALLPYHFKYFRQSSNVRKKDIDPDMCAVSLLKHFHSSYNSIFQYIIHISLSPIN